jgi:hypothetical protein
MSRILCHFCAAVALLGLANAARAQDETFGGKTRAQWLQVLAKDKQPRKRQAAVEILVNAEEFGIKASGVLPGLITALQKDDSPEVRTAVAQTLGGIGEDAKAAVQALGRGSGRRQI